MNIFLIKKIPDNICLGVTVEAKLLKKRIKYLTMLKPNISFLSCEPLLEDLGNLDLQGIDWIIVGGESGIKGRLMKKEWVYNIKKQAEKNNTSFFFKQWGTWGSDGIKRNRKANGRLLDGKLFNQIPFCSN